jgi:nucleoside phosphorylase
LVLSTACVEYDLGPDGTPAATQLPPEIFSSLLELDSARRAVLEEGAVRVAASSGILVRSGLQACGERAVRSTAARRALHRRFHAAAANWETAGVFAAARRNAVPALSLRVVTDLGDEAATRQFRLNARRRSRRLYEFVRELTERGWFAGFQGGARC